MPVIAITFFLCLINSPKELNFWKFTSYCSLKPLWSSMGKVVPARTSPTLHPPSPPTAASIVMTSTLRVKPQDWQFAFVWYSIAHSLKHRNVFCLNQIFVYHSVITHGWFHGSVQLKQIMYSMIHGIESTRSSNLCGRISRIVFTLKLPFVYSPHWIISILSHNIQTEFVYMDIF